jgi:menaquinone-dependent protoporphyrinogen oxidase
VASRHGSTAEIAQRIATTLEAGGLETTVTAPDRVTSIAGYDAVILGSAIYMGHWLEPATAFARRWSTELGRMPVWAFSSGPLGDPPMPPEPSPEVIELIQDLGPREHQIFSGDLDPAELGFTEKVVTRVVRAPKGDYRDWPTVEAWARRIAATLIDELGWRTVTAGEREEKLREFWRREMESADPVG